MFVSTVLSKIWAFDIEFIKLKRTFKRQKDARFMYIYLEKNRFITEMFEKYL